MYYWCLFLFVLTFLTILSDIKTCVSCWTCKNITHIFHFWPLSTDDQLCCSSWLQVTVSDESLKLRIWLGAVIMSGCQFPVVSLFSINLVQTIFLYFRIRHCFLNFPLSNVHFVCAISLSSSSSLNPVLFSKSESGCMHLTSLKIFAQLSSI